MSGRPKIDPADTSVEMCLTLPSKRYDALYARARAERVSVPELVRRVLDRRISIGKVPDRKPSR